jgi:flagellar biosynthetic protein FliR
MPVQDALNFIPVFVLVFFRTAGLFLASPLFGSAMVPRRVKVMFALVMAAGLAGGVKAPPNMPGTVLQMVAGITGEMIFGLLMGLGLSLAFIAVSWGGEIMGQQMGINIASAFDPQFGGGGSLVGDLYFMLTLVIFLLLNGHHAMVEGLAASFGALPLLAAGMTKGLFDLFIGLITAATVLAFKVASPMLVTMLVVDVALGFLGKTVPQINVMNAGLTLRSGLGIAVMIVGLMLTNQIMQRALFASVEALSGAWHGWGRADGGGG